jgi:menaquinone-dependent protoporphyrinogen oxidase
MRILISAASRHGATAEIAERIGDVLRTSLPGASVDVRPPSQVDAVDEYDAVVLGSAVYMGRWLEDARTLTSAHADRLSGRPVWLFSSGPIGDPPRPEEEAADVTPAMVATGARAHKIFAGRIDRHLLGFGERAVLLAVRAQEGDFRDWAAIDAWAAGIAADLRASTPAVAG